MINFLYANGCSWTNGNGLYEDPIFKGTPTATNKVIDQSRTWPAELGRMLNCNVKNDSKGAGSNARMVRTTINFIQRFPKEKHNELLIVLGWSTIERDEIFIDHPGYNDWFNYNAVQPFSDQFAHRVLSPDMKSMNKNIDKAQKEYVTWVHNARNDIEQYFTQLYLMSNLLQNLEIKHIMFTSLPWIWGLDWEILEPLLPRYSKLLTENFIGNEVETMESFCRDNQFRMSSCMHPLIDAHTAWAHKLHNNITRLYPNE